MFVLYMVRIQDRNVFQFVFPMVRIQRNALALYMARNVFALLEDRIIFNISLFFFCKYSILIKCVIYLFIASDEVQFSFS